jgi:7-carboxy-7-deazaguanine synthase
MTYSVVEIFDSIQGEGSEMGRMATFIRLAGCNLKCPWCDTDFTTKETLSVEEICSRVTQRNVIITGGEPTLWDLTPLLLSLRNSPNGPRHISLETNGTRPLQKYLGLLDWVVCSPKREAHFLIDELAVRWIDELKFVVDADFTVEELPTDLLSTFAGKIWLQPESSEMQKNMKRVVEFVALYPTVFRAGIQLHKIMEVK